MNNPAIAALSPFLKAKRFSLPQQLSVHLSVSWYFNYLGPGTVLGGYSFCEVMCITAVCVQRTALHSTPPHLTLSQRSLNLVGFVRCVPSNSLFSALWPVMSLCINCYIPQYIPLWPGQEKHRWTDMNVNIWRGVWQHDSLAHQGGNFIHTQCQLLTPHFEDQGSSSLLH